MLEVIAASVRLMSQNREVLLVWNITDYFSKVQATQMNVLRRIEGVNRLDRVRNADIRERLNQESVLDLVKRRLESWKGRLEEMSFEKTTKKVFVGEMEGRRPR